MTATHKTRVAKAKEPKQLVSIRQVAEAMGFSERQVRTWLDKEQIPLPVLVVGNRKWIMRADLDTFLAGRLAGRTEAAS